MPRKGPVPKREVLPDPLYGSTKVTKLINNIMLDGKKGTAQKIVYGAFEKVQEKTGKDALEAFDEALRKTVFAAEKALEHSDPGRPTTLLDEAELRNNLNELLLLLNQDDAAACMLFEKLRPTLETRNPAASAEAAEALGSFDFAAAAEALAPLI